MKLLKLFGMVLMGGALALSCVIDPGGDETTNPASDIDWTNYQTAGTYSIRVKNESNRDLVAFMNSLTRANMLGGVKKNSGDHGFKKDTALFNQNKDFSVIFITAEEYETNKSKLDVLEQRPFTRLFAMYNNSGTNEVPFIVSSRLGGENKLVMHNMTPYNMELRQDSPRGTTLGYAPYETNNTTLYMGSSDFYIYPVFKKYNAARDEILTIYPRNASNRPMGTQAAFSGGQEITIRADQFIGNTNFSSGVAYLLVKNNTASGGFSVQKGTTTMKTESGIETINGGEERTFVITMPGENGNYETSTSFSGWQISFMGWGILDIPALESMEADYRYTVTVTGDFNQSTEQISTLVKGGKKITAEVLGEE